LPKAATSKAKEPGIKTLFKGIFQTNAQIKILYASAYSEKQAEVFMCRRMAREIGIRESDILGYFRERGSYAITKETLE
jgi:hypothetical protein